MVTGPTAWTGDDFVALDDGHLWVLVKEASPKKFQLSIATTRAAVLAFAQDKGPL